MIKIAGAGWGKKELPLKAYEELNKNYVILRSSKTASCKGLRFDRSFDELYDAAEDFDSLYRLMAEEVIRAEEEFGDITYIVDGDGYFDRSVMELYKLRPDVVFLSGKGIPSVYTVSVSAYEIDNVAVLDTAACLKVTDVDSREVCGDVKLKLMEFYLDEEQVWFFSGNEKRLIPLFELDRQPRYDAATAVVVPPVTRLNDRRHGIDSLIRIMDRLTAPDGCEWDKVQTHKSIRINLIEEAYEAVDAINSDDLDAMIEEFGDVLLQAVFHCVIAKNSGEFDFSDVTTRLCEKLVTRHTHVFGLNKADDPASALGFWEKAKAAEKNYTSLYDQLSRLPQDFPSLLTAQKLYKKLIKSPSVINDGTGDSSSLSKSLFLAAALCAQSGIDAEVALREYCNKLRARVEKAENSGDFHKGVRLSELLCDE